MNVNPTLSQSKRKEESLHLKGTKQSKQKIEQLLSVDIIFKVKYPTWLANPVMIKKPDGGWRTCVDFIDMNKA